MRSSESKNVIREIIDINDRLQKAVAQGSATSNKNTPNTQIVEQLLKMGANINASNAVQSTPQPIDALMAIAGRLLAEALNEQLSPTPNQPLDPFWVNDTGFHLGFAKVSPRLKERTAPQKPADLPPPMAHFFDGFR